MSSAEPPLVDISTSRAALLGRASGILSQARWASEAFRRYGLSRVREIAEAVADAGSRDAGFFAEWAVRETGFGVAEHKRIKNELTSRGLFEHYRDADFVTPQVDEAARIVRLPRPAGVVFALAPSTNPIATVNFKILIALLTRNAIVLSPHPAARECSAEAVRRLADAAAGAGAPDGCIQVIEEPAIPLVEEFLRSPDTDVILATGGTAMVRSAYASSNPAIGVGPGNAPVFVGESADLRAAAKRIIESKSFDNSILCTNESVVFGPERIAAGLVREMERAGAKHCNAEQAAWLRRFLFDGERFNVEAIGRDARWIAAQAEIAGVGSGVRVLLAPLEGIGPEEPLSREKLCPVLGLRIVRDARQGIRDSRALLRFSGAGHSAAIHSEDRQEIMDFASAVEVYRVVVNAPCSQGAAGFGTGLAPTFTVGTGYFGRSSIGENIGPQHLVHWTQVAYRSDPDEAMGDYRSLRLDLPGPLPRAPADGVPGESRPAPKAAIDGDTLALIRRLVAEELRSVRKERGKHD